jgi:uncharacterized protein Yka (UPF0111/DUF47 family)
MKRWFLPAQPDLMGLLAEQGRVTIEGIDAFVEWAAGAEGKGDEVRVAEHGADDARRAVQRALRIAFTTPLSAEDLYELSERLDAVLNGAKNLVREAELLALGPDQAIADMAVHVGEGTHELVAAFAVVASDGDTAIERADAAIRASRKLEHRYRDAMSALLAVNDAGVLFERRELYRRCARIGDDVVRAAERVWYSVVKEA